MPRLRVLNLFLSTLLCAASLSMNACVNTNTEDLADAVGKPGAVTPTATPEDPTFVAFRTNFWTPMRSETCTICHGNGLGPQHLAADPAAAWAVAQQYINLSNPGASRIVTYPASGHNPCPPDAAGCAAKIQSYIEDMQRAL